MEPCFHFFVGSLEIDLEGGSAMLVAMPEDDLAGGCAILERT